MYNRGPLENQSRDPESARRQLADRVCQAEWQIMLSGEKFAGRALLLIVIVTAIPVVPMLFLGNSWGHDFDLHVPSWMETEQQFREGILYPRWVARANYGFGEPLFIFYPPISRMIGAALGLILPWRMVPGAYVWLALILAGAAMWRCAREWLDPPDAVMASLLYALNPYLIVTAYKRCNYAELLASALFPLLVWGGIRIGRDATKTLLPLAVVFAAIWLSDLPAGVIAAYSLAWLLLGNALIRRSPRPVWYGAIAILAGFGSIAFFLIPATWEQKWVNIAETLRYQWVPENNFLFAQTNTPQMLSFNRALSFIALALVIVTAIAAILSRRLRRDDRDVWLLLASLGGLSAFLMFSPSSILWRILPELRFVEFPWRWLSPLCTVGALLTASAVAQARRKWALWVAIGFIVVGIGATVVHTVTWNSRHLEDLAVAAHSKEGYRSVAQWCWPRDSHPSELPNNASLVASPNPEDERDVSQQRVKIHVDLWSPERKVFSVDSPRPLLLQVKLLNYPAWQARLDGKVVDLETKRESGQMLLPVPAGSSHAEIKFARTWDRTVGIGVSLATVLAFFPLMSFLRRRETSARSG